MFVLVLLVALMPSVLAQTPCNPREYEFESFVCVCDGTYCDFPGTIEASADNTEFTRVRSDRDSYRFEVETGFIEATATSELLVHVNLGLTYQTMFGFGGAFTDSTGYNVQQLSQEAQDMFTRSYFAPEGIQYDVCRIPIAGSDFSTRPYSYDDTWNDEDLSEWTLASEDYAYKFPYIHAAQAVSDREILFFGSPWAPPAWMKESGMTNGSGGLLDTMWDPYSNYLVKFVEAYEAEGIPMWGITPQNEPLTGYDDWAWNTCLFTEFQMRDWIKNSFGPIMEAAGLRRVKVMILDHNRDAIPWYPETTLRDADASKYVDGTAVHWYSDSNTGPGVLSELQADYQDKFILYTEACEGWYDGKVNLGDWERAQNYANNIIEDVNHFSTGWVDWNMALSMTGGPNWANNFVDSPIIIDPGRDEFMKQPMFYAMGHFSKFIEPNSTKIYSSVDFEYNDIISQAGFQNPDGTFVLVILNKNENATAVSIEARPGTFININMTPKSIETILINP